MPFSMMQDHVIIDTLKERLFDFAPFVHQNPTPPALVAVTGIEPAYVRQLGRIRFGGFTSPQPLPAHSL